MKLHRVGPQAYACDKAYIEYDPEMQWWNVHTEVGIRGFNTLRECRAFLDTLIIEQEELEV